ncbi:MAG: hypothetical protein KIS75_10700 [Chromatiales bacterium]|nr:hypothetical protein [Chromatiales bacterium]
MTTRHNVSHADAVFMNGAYHPGVYATNQRRGGPIGNLVQIELGTPTVGAVDTVAAAQAVAAAGYLTLGGLTTLDVARAVSITASGNSAAVVFTITGTDIHGIPVVETITGVNANTVAGKKAFKTITSVHASAAATGNVSVGDTDVLGLPFRLNRRADLLAQFADATEESASSTIVAGVATAATATTGDVRGTINPDTTLDGSVAIYVWMRVDGRTPEALGGVAQYAG